MIQFKSTKTPQAQSYDCLCIGLYSNQSLSDTISDDNIRGVLSALDVASMMADGDFTGDLGSTHFIFLSDAHAFVRRVVLLGLGEFEKLNQVNYDTAIEKAIAKLIKLPIGHLGFYLGKPVDGFDYGFVLQHLAFKWTYQTYQFNAQAIDQGIDIYLSDKPKKKNIKTKNKTLKKISCIISPSAYNLQEAERKLLLGKHLGIGINSARFLGDLPANICTPTYLSDFAKQMAKSYDNLQVHVKGEAEIKALGMNGLLSVSQGSQQEAKLIEIKYTPDNVSDETIALVGKGVTFDTGGISIKPSAKMDEMKYDMCGAASVIGTMQCLAENRTCQHHVVAIIPATENMPSGVATKPGDVFLSYSGQTVEVLNTDAEGRLILADALSYAEATYCPNKMINVATLTGACIIALGHHRSALMSNNDQLAHELMEVGQTVLDPCWQLPLDDQYDALLHSNFADMANIGGREAGTITAGCFLKRFVKKSLWVHLDIAGVAWLEGKRKGATGRPVSLLASWLIRSQNHNSI